MVLVVIGLKGSLKIAGLTCVKSRFPKRTLIEERMALVPTKKRIIKNPRRSREEIARMFGKSG